MANKKDTKKRIDATIKTTPANVVDVFVDYAVQEQIKAADVPPRKRLDISFSDASKIGDNKSDTNQEAYEKAHGKLYNMTHNNTIPWRNYVVYLILLTMLTCCFTFSKYLSNATADGNVAVAKFYVISSASLNGTDFNISPSSTSTVTVNEGDTNDQKVVVKVSSTSEVKVKVTVTQTNNTFGNRFQGDNNTFYIDKTDGKNAKEGTATFLFKPSALSTSGLTTGSDKKYNLGNLKFNVYIEQVD